MSVKEKIEFQRRLDLEGAPNIRDLGGYETLDGSTTRWGRIFRAGRLSSLTARDKAQLQQFNLRVICDFRREDEYLQDITDLGDFAEAAIHNLAISPGDHTRSIAMTDFNSVSGEQMFEWMVLINRELALKQTQTYRRMFELLLETEDGGFLFHCSAGKDRTGFAAALILSALDVPRDTIMEDYLLTAQYYPPKGELEYLASKYTDSSRDVDLSAYQALMDTREEYLSAAFSAIEEHYDSVDTYLSGELGIGKAERELLKHRYTE
ncbi:protein-tyrosine phosphatase [Litorivivens lipolytica]|uniref:Protein-tyrosine phosphatase n=1 Tax=Litorivivens lipolytica TaxID=1524264 RepID=A0A7W4W6P8_9GAMM|nr:tyrosine-protein phosphatase [Litorivivens lipolytica]MBB3047847.1 protein-tyrosine phosphatase [Litorivivens lipolytica]